MSDGRESGLVEATRRGDDRALEELLSRVQPQIYRFSMKMCRDPEDAKDVLQETLFAAARTVRGFRGDSAVSTWLYTIARSFCIKKRRRRVGAAETLSLDSDAAERGRAVPDGGRGPEQVAHDHELASALQAAISALEPGYREVLVLRDVEGLAAEEVAKVTGLSVAAVKSRLHRARAAVRERLLPLVTRGPSPEAAASCPDVVSLLSRHLEGDIDPTVCALMEQHLAACPRCRAACDSLRESLRVCRQTTLPAIPTDLQESIRSGIRRALAQAT